ncbi:acyltransferase family protein [Leptolyngbya sp. 7M]|uniref:acyltransferase family protein n=1 Tax=Leptolyngbya sp. 7M TaxID=2812896 RepID=UPI001B8B43CF|nr:acyltransferase family protein [Leptolyngbya sp. 7M]QYO62362.1 acyltransferase family protein [Leptolyngbya sp. 7M]QYU68807.1 acyltransferase family protein [Leptolyngbya sp. 15MV]
MGSQGQNLSRESGHAVERQSWIDLARGICITLVVMMHFDEVYFTHLNVPELAKKVSDNLTSLARPARMPTFFFISGYLASRALIKPIKVAAEKRIFLLYWTYLIWSIICVSILYLLFENFSSENTLRFFERIALEAIFPQTSTWFLYGLVLFFIIAKIFRNYPRIAIAIALIFSCFSDVFIGSALSEMIRTLPYFLAGIYFPSLFLRAGDPGGGWRSVFAVAILYGIFLIPLVLLDRNLPGIWLPPTFVGIVLLLQISRNLDRVPGVDFIRYVGRNTLPIYVMHVIILICIRTFSEDVISLETGWALAFSLAGNLALIAFCLLLHTFLKKLGFGWLFALPDFLRSRLISARGQVERQPEAV